MHRFQLPKYQLRLVFLVLYNSKLIISLVSDHCSDDTVNLNMSIWVLYVFSLFSEI